MDEAIEIGRILHDTPDLFPWVVLAIICLVVFAERKRILGYFDARIDAYNSKKQSDALMAELIRNNTAALENNTAALESVKADRGETRRLLNYHEEASKERMEHIQTVVNDVRSIVSENSESIKVVEDRTVRNN